MRSHNGVFSNERTITDADDHDARHLGSEVAHRPAMSPTLPRPRQWPASEGWTIGEPDLVLDMGQDYFVEDDVEDQYIRFTTRDHRGHAPGTALDPGGRVPSGNARWCTTSSPVPSVALPRVTIRPDLQRWLRQCKLQPGTELTWQMHYHKEAGEGTGVLDRSSVAVRFYPKGYEPDHIVLE